MDGSSDSEDEPCSSVLNRLESRDEVGRKSKQNAVTIVKSIKDECDNKRLEHCSWYLPPDGTQLACNDMLMRYVSIHFNLSDT